MTPHDLGFWQGVAVTLALFIAIGGALFGVVVMAFRSIAAGK